MTIGNDRDQVRTVPQTDGNPAGSGQPRWAWWVVGIVIPIIGILVTLLAGRTGDPSTEARGDSEKPPAGSSGSEGLPAPDPQRAPKIMYGPEVIAVKVSAYGSNLELDSSKPMPLASGKGSDLTATSAGDGTNASTRFFAPPAEDRLAPLPQGSPKPTAAACDEAIRRNASYEMDDLISGRQFCMYTDEGRTAYVRVISAPPAGNVIKMEVTVWNLAS
ncbi:hypothetical protein ACFTWD_24295 [Streptomyces sp. NPDC056943]|uniref:hypothetical protein n=1 Tax=Streptomyces sp. NPDC056943 TaxID=3345971 RepID=UPI0036343828